MHAVRLSCLALVAAAIGGGPFAATAQAGCGGVQKLKPTAKQRLGKFRSPLVIGDSVLLGALPQVAREGFEVNARGCRPWDEGRSYLYKRRHVGELPHEVVMFLGADFSVSMDQIRQALKIVGHDRVLVLLTPREVGGFGGSDARHVREAGRLYPNRVLVLDWVKYTRKHPNWFAPDGLHLGYGGAAALARLLRRALPYAKPGKFPGPQPPPPPPPSSTPQPPPDQRAQERAASA
jgi:hypothetical protein